MKRYKPGFTLIELLVVLSIIAMLVAILMPSIAMVKRTARETKQKAQFATIEMALDAFKRDYGDYPPSLGVDPMGAPYCGAQKLAEAMVGKDLLGFHPDSKFLAARQGGPDRNLNGMYFPALNGWTPADSLYTQNLQARKGPYIELEAANVFQLTDLYIYPGNPLGLGVFPTDTNSIVLCDSFPRRTVQAGRSRVKAGTPILYYKANTSSKVFDSANPGLSIYNENDNIELIALGKLPFSPSDLVEQHLLAPAGNFYSPQYQIINPKVPTAATVGGWPHRPDSYILISAGNDGEYGTRDDIFNF